MLRRLEAEVDMNAPSRVASLSAGLGVAAVDLGWEIIAEDPSTGRLEATDTSALFQFVDDVAVRIRPTDGGVVIDVRSKSRDGRGDLGANAARIRAFRDALAG
jgi:uncharacterized protein (DUF1499 family)